MLPGFSRYFAKIVAILLIVAAVPIAAAAQDFTIENYESTITIHEDSSATVIESITVDFSRNKHGIYREIPYKYRDELGGTLRTPIEVLSVTDENGKPWNYRVSKRGSIVHIRIGNAKKYVSGKKTYVITYDVQNAILFLDDYDELYWNVTGNYWKAPIKEASARVELSVGGQSDKLLTACFTGPSGSRETACSKQASQNSSEFSTDRPLKPGEGFTIVFGWQKGLVTPPSDWQKFLWTLNLRENWVFLLPIASLLFILNAWRKKGRDPRVREAVTVAYGPPKYMEKELTPAEVGTLVDEKLDSRDITSAIVGLGVKGYLRIEEKTEEGWVFNSTDYTLLKTKDPDDALTEFEKLLMEKLFSESSSMVRVSDLKNKFYTNLSSLKSALYSDLVAKGYFASSPEKVRKTYFTIGMFLTISLAMAFGFFSPNNFYGVLAGVLTGLPIVALARFMPAKTTQGALAHAQTLGFEEFLTRAEKDRLERLGDKHLFSKFLPYAIALDVAESWARAFEGIYQEPPQWYTSPHAGRFTTFSPRSFSSSVSTMTSSLGSAMFSAPRGSGGGGGSSGGGFGGGGGGSW